MLEIALFIAVFFFLTTGCVALALYPFRKVYNIVRTNHPDLWSGLGKPPFKKVFTDPKTRKLFTRIINLSEFNKDEIKHDQDLINYTRTCKTLYESVARQRN